MSSANLTGQPAATTASLALESLGDSVDVYLDGGETDTVTSTIVDASSFAADGSIRIVRHGAVSEEQLRNVLGDVLLGSDRPADRLDG